MNLPIVKSDIPSCGAEVIRVCGEGLSLPVDQQSSRCASKSHHRQVEHVVWWWDLIGQHGSPETLKQILIRHEYQKGCRISQRTRKQKCAHLRCVELQNPSRIIALADGDLRHFHAWSFHAGLPCYG